MPIYEYKCVDCCSKFEVLVFSDNKKIGCEKCGSNNTTRLLSGFATCGNSSATTSCAGSGKFT